MRHEEAWWWWVRFILPGLCSKMKEGRGERERRKGKERWKRQFVTYPHYLLNDRCSPESCEIQFLAHFRSPGRAVLASLWRVLSSRSPGLRQMATSAWSWQRETAGCRAVGVAAHITLTFWQGREDTWFLLLEVLGYRIQPRIATLLFRAPTWSQHR